MTAHGKVLVETQYAPGMRTPSVAVLVPCYNEAATIGGVVADFRAALPDARVYVYDNNSSDETVKVARDSGAIVRVERRQGKGHVMRRMFADVEADIYILVDGDGTYEAAASRRMLDKFIAEDLDLLNASRIASTDRAYRMGHRFGNRALTGLVRLLFGREFEDMLSGYKVMSRRFVKSFPAMSSGFEAETEIAVHALELRIPCGEFPTHYRERPEGSASKLRTFRDGARILFLITRLVKDERPLLFFSAIAAVNMLLALSLIAPVLATYLETGLVPRLPTAVLSLGLVIISVLCFFTGLILDMTTRMRQELKRLLYLSLSGHSNSPR